MAFDALKSSVAISWVKAWACLSQPLIKADTESKSVKHKNESKNFFIYVPLSRAKVNFDFIGRLSNFVPNKV